MILFFLKMFGIYFGYSVIRFYFSKKLIQEQAMTKIVSAYFVIQLFQTLFLQKIFVQWCLVFVPVFVFICAHFIFVRRLESRFRYDFPAIVTNIILQMKMGQSFRASLLKTIAQVPPRYRIFLQSIYDHVAFSQQQNDKKMALKSTFADQILQFFLQVDHASHRTVEKLENFRTRLIILNEFRRRSGRIREQILMQATVLTIIYALSFAFVVYCFSAEELFKLLLLSFLLFVAGLFTIFMMGRRWRWNI